MRALKLHSAFSVGVVLLLFASSAAAQNGTPADSVEVWANYEFVPGDSVLFYHDFEGTRVGNFPSRLDYIAGDMDVVRFGRGADANRALHSGVAEAGRGAKGCFTIPLSETLPEQFTLEFRVRYEDGQGRVKYYLFSDGSDDTPDTRCNYPPNPHVFVVPGRQGLQLPGGYGATTSDGKGGLMPNEWSTVALGCDGPYCKMYVNGTRVANVPTYEFPRAEKLHFFFNGAGPMYVDDLRIAEGGARSLYDDLEAEGFVSTNAIRFDSGSATLKSESGGMLGEVLLMLEDHPDLHLVVEGHTDADGADEANQTLSEQRAEAVAAWLTGQGIATDRLDTAGRGESQPVADNETDEGKAQNRRVVFRDAAQ